MAARSSGPVTNAATTSGRDLRQSENGAATGPVNNTATTSGRDLRQSENGAATGPRTAEGNARSSKNALKHGLSIGYLHVPAEEQAEYDGFVRETLVASGAVGAIEVETALQIAEAAWSLRRIMRLHQELALQHGQDPLLIKDCTPALKQLARYRAAQEMAFYRAMKMLRDLQEQRLAREMHLNKVEDKVVAPHVRPTVYAKTELRPDERTLRMLELGMMGDNPRWTVQVDNLGYPSWVSREQVNPAIPIRENLLGSLAYSAAST